MEQQFGKYQLVRRIGAGGFGVVYEGYDPTIRRRVAIKTCTSVDPRVRMRFAREAEVNGNLSHPNIVVVFDYGEVDGSPYLVQEFLSGEDLDVKIDRGERIPLAQKVNYLIQIADGLSHAHRQGVVHRDVKPANIRVLDTGVVKVMDFGIAWIKNDASITLTGRTVGTAAYMAPEQLRNESVGPQTDIFSFGVLAYELLTGERAFAGDSASQILYQVLSVEPPPIRSLCPEVPAELAALVAGCHRKDPEERYHNLEALIPAFRHLERQAAGLDTAGLPIPMPPKAPAAVPTNRVAPAASALDGAPDERTVPLRQPAATAPPRSARLDSIELRGAAPRPAAHAALAGFAAAGRSRGWPLVPIAAAIAVLALIVTAAARWHVVESWWSSGQEARTDSDGSAPESSAASDQDETRASEPSAEAPPEVPARSEPTVPAPQPAAQEVADAPASSSTPGAEAHSPSPASDTPRAIATPPSSRPVAARGAISVRASLGAPQAWAWLDDRSLGRTPVRRAPIAPGRHRLRLALDPSSSAGAPEWEVRVASGQELILTIDIVSGAPPREVRRPLAP
jgi:serine/threonine-protein kinase